MDVDGEEGIEAQKGLSTRPLESTDKWGSTVLAQLCAIPKSLLFPQHLCSLRSLVLERPVFPK